MGEVNQRAGELARVARLWVNHNSFEILGLLTAL